MPQPRMWLPSCGPQNRKIPTSGKNFVLTPATPTPRCSCDALGWGVAVRLMMKGATVGIATAHASTVYGELTPFLAWHLFGDEGRSAMDKFFEGQPHSHIAK